MVNVRTSDAFNGKEAKMQVAITEMTQVRMRGKASYPRVYVNVEGAEFDELQTRLFKTDETKEEKAITRAGYNAQRKVLRDTIYAAFLRMGFNIKESVQATKDCSWDWYAGCSSCRCSSGFVYKGSSMFLARDLHIDADVVSV
jgi:hypothetical protein